MKAITPFHYRTDWFSKFLALPLWPFSLFYSLGHSFRLLLYDLDWFEGVKVEVPVISVGNLTTGGTGKTPVIIAMAQYLEEQGHKVVVLSRGYGASKPQVYAEATDPAFGDEAYLIQQHLDGGKVIVGKNRRKTAQWAITDYKPDIILLDDGFQHIGLQRDLNLVLIDGELGLGNGFQLPAGPLRESINALKRATHVLLTKTIQPAIKEDISNKAQRINSDLMVGECPFQASHLFHPFSGRVNSFMEMEDLPYAIISGIAHPDTLENEAQKRLKGDMAAHLRFQDHHQYKADDLEDLLLLLKNYKDCRVITTGKDWVKLKPLIIPEFLNRFYILEVKPLFNWALLIDPLNLGKGKSPKSQAVGSS